MASSDNLTSLEPWLFRPTFPTEPWLSDAFARDADVLTRAFTNSISTPAGFSPSDDHSLFNVFDFPVSNPDTPRTSISVSGSDPDTATKKPPRRGAPGPTTGRVGKRKSRASKKSPTTFITADAENFRQMVQHVTGGAMFAPVADPSMLGTIVKPAAQRLAVGGRIHGYLPTLDTSAFLLEHHQQVSGHTGGSVANLESSSAAAFAFPSGGEIGCDGSGGVVDISSLNCFPTLDSWEVM